MCPANISVQETDDSHQQSDLKADNKSLHPLFLSPRPGASTWTPAGSDEVLGTGKGGMKLRRGVQGLAVHLREAGHGQAGVEPAAAGPDYLVMSLSG